jgi:SEC-C motif-containing protein
MSSLPLALCPCGSDVDAKACCEPIIAGDTQARAAVDLMRARYTAFVTGRMNGDFVRKTTAPETRSIASGVPSPHIGGLDLEIRNVVGGGPDDQTGTVEFVARLVVDGRADVHHEISRFRRDAGQWVYIDGSFPTNAKAKPVTKIGRNDPCPCGSGKKFKQCCGG